MPPTERWILLLDFGVMKIFVNGCLMFCYGSDCDVDLQFRLFFPLLSHKAPIFVKSLVSAR